MSTPVQQGKVQSTGISGKKGQCTARQSSWQWNFGPQNYRTNGNYQQGINVTKAKAQLNNQVGYGPLGHKTVKQNNHKVITVGQSPATWDRTFPRNLLQMTAKGKPGCL